MSIKKSDILKRYRTMSDEEFSQIRAKELTDDGRAAYSEERTRRSTSEYIEQQKQLESQYEESKKGAEVLSSYNQRLRKISSIGTPIALIALFVMAILIPMVRRHMPTGILFWMAIVGPIWVVIWLVARLIVKSPKL